MTYRGGYAMFHEAVAILAARGVFDPTEVTDYDIKTGKSTALVIGADDSFIQMFPKYGLFKGCLAERIEGKGIGNFFTVSYDADRGQFIERMQFETSRELPDKLIVTLSLKDFTYEYFSEGKSEFAVFKGKRTGKFRRPDKQELDERAAERREEQKLRREEEACNDYSHSGGEPSADRGECTTGGDSGRTIQHTSSSEKHVIDVPDNTHERSEGHTPVDTRRVISGFRRCGSVRYRDDRDTSIREQGLPDGESRTLSQGECDKSRHEGHDKKPDRRILKGFSKPNLSAEHTTCSTQPVLRRKRIRILSGFRKRR